MAIAVNDFKDGLTFTGGGNGDAPTFTLLGGRYDMAVNATFSGGNIDLQILMPDGSTYQSVLAAPFTAAGSVVLDLPPGSYKIVVTTATSAQGFLIRVPFRAA